MVVRLRSGLTRIDRWLAVRAAHGGSLASLYYLFFNRAFAREQRAVLAGRRRYLEARSASVDSDTLLRRNIHRLEKGLVMRPRRAVFAEEYIGETVEAFGGDTVRGGLCAEEWRWAADVLGAYFDVVSDTPVIAPARRAFADALVRAGSLPPSGETIEPSKPSVPYRYADLPGPPLEMADFERLCRRRRSVRWFDGRRVPRGLLDRAIEVAALAPSACNRQPYLFYVAEEPDRARELAALAGGTVGYAEHVPCTVAVVGDLSAYPLERDRHLIYIDGGLAAMQFMLALDCLGLASCPINWPDVEQRERQIERLLGLSPAQRVVMLIAVGFADPEGLIPFSQKKTLPVLVRRV